MTESAAATPTERRWKKPLFIAAGAVAAVVVLVLAARFLASAVAGDQALYVEPGIAVSVEVTAGSSARDIATAMEQAGVVKAGDLRALVDEQGVASQLQAGTYHLETLMAPEAVVERLLTGPDTPTGSGVIVYEGHDIRRIFPARYELREGATPTEILTVLADEMVRRVNTVDWSRLDELGVTRYEALIVASLIQREAGVNEDRPLIASVIYNRLDEGMPLQIDATVVYALGESPGRVLAEHLKIDSPWNTYRVKGLPPTPIGTAQIESIEAAAAPAETDYFFYVLVSPDGRHGFSKTYEEHKEKIAQAKKDGVLP